MKKSVSGLLFATLLGSGAAAAQAQQPSHAGTAPQAAQAKPAPAAKLPSADEVFDNYIKALGGREALGKLKSRVSKGTVELAPMNARGTFETSQKAPGKSVTTMNISGLGSLQSGYDGSVGWSKDPFSGLREMKGGELLAAQRAALLSPADWRKVYSRMTVTGQGKVGDRDAYIVEATPASGDPDKMYFDAQTGLLLRMDGVLDSPQGRIMTETYFEDYREVDGVKLSHSARAVLGPVTIITRLEEVKHDVALDDAIFNKPAS